MLKTCCMCKIAQDTDNFCQHKNRLDNLSDQCRHCAKLYRQQHQADKKKYQSSSPEYKKEYRRQNKERANYLRRLNRKNNPDKYRQLAKLRYQKNKRSIREHQKKYYLAHKNYFQSKNKNYRLANREYILLKNRKRKRLLSGSNISQLEIKQLLIKHNNSCYYCKCSVNSGFNLHLDHKIPLVRGGQHNIHNLVPACATCNLRKGTKTDIEFQEMSISNGS
jgi:5-methylcytosine-specific restriction endonuclease McrA